jgi:DNA polymerase-3 subunit delta'
VGQTVTALYNNVVGQEAAVGQLQASARQPVHAYLLVGPPGTGKRAAALSFAASLLCPAGGDGTCPTCVRVRAGAHPDVVVLERKGAAILVDDAREISRLAVRSPVEGGRKVLVLTEFHLVDKAAPALLKTIEEPPESTVFVITAELVPPELVTIASRCCRIDFGPVPVDRLVEVLVGDGVAEAEARQAAVASAGRLDRARLLASDPAFAARRAAWADAPGRLNGTGATAAAVAAELLEVVDGVLEPVRARQEEEKAAVDARAKEYGERGIGRKDLETRQRREQRRARMDELRSGLSILAGVYRDRLVEGGADARSCVEAVDAIRSATEGLVHNPNEALLLQALLVKLSRTPAILAGRTPG